MSKLYNCLYLGQWCRHMDYKIFCGQEKQNNKYATSYLCTFNVCIRMSDGPRHRFGPKLTCALTACDSPFHPHRDSVTLLEGKQLRENMEIDTYDIITNIHTILPLSLFLCLRHTHTHNFVSSTVVLLQKI